MSRRSVIGNGVLVVSGMGFPLTQLAIRRFGRRGAILVDGVCAGLLLRDAALIARGTPGRLQRVPAVLLWLEALAGTASVALGVLPVLDEEARRRALESRPATAFEIARRGAVGTLFGLHTWRFRIYLGRDRGRRSA